MVPAAFIRFHLFRRANVRISEIRCTIKNVARTIYFILFHVRCAGMRRRHSPVPLDRAGQVQRTSSWSFCCSWTSFVRQSPTEAAVTATGHHHCWANSVLITPSGQLAIQGGGRSLRSITALSLVCKKKLHCVPNTTLTSDAIASTCIKRF